MYRFALALLLSASMVPAGAAHATPVAYDFNQVLRLTSGSITVPPQWDGVWTTQDSVYDCTTGFQQLVTGADTLCSGQVYTVSSAGSPVTITCTGTADATSFHATCSGTGTIFTDCQLTIDIQIDAILTGDTFRSVTTTNTSYSGTGTGCNLLQPSCTRSVTYGTRTGPAPTAYCLTPAKRATWGQLKETYR